MTLSTSVATADSGSLLGGVVTSSVSSLSSAPAPTPVAPSPGLLQPLAGSLAGGSDQFVAALPVVNRVVPAGTVTAVSAPVAAAADDAGAGLVDTVSPPLADAFPVLEPVLQPVADLVNGDTPLPVSWPEPPVAATDASAEAVSGDPGTAGGLPPMPLADQDGSFLKTVAGTVGWTVSSELASTGTPSASAGMQSASPDIPWTDDPSPAPAPAGPSSGPGSGSSQSGSPGFVAWLDTNGLYLPLPGVFPISGSAEHAPSPVSFDPGSSPD
ncbi:hypothetical protein [Arthrobacter pascens]|uniref:hypothetical protein n=1 Tax=Arthrobacter pascens TaxID=1677 RepID=UPI0027D924CE|nr:hypothetical protein [Arthrobacter pascens]